ncbi:MAG: glutathione S-transferase family protein [Alphaproteobacteria bacterium]|nr:glutathione S-transferase family protein [Alphaproteobacteria bacterium]
MKLYVAAMAPNPDRVRFFLQEKGVWDLVERVEVSIMKKEHKEDGFRAKSPLSQLPTLELDDKLVLTESRAICTYFEGIFPDPNLMGVDARERAVIEMWDRRVELSYLMHIASWFRNSHPAMVELEAPQCAEWSEISSERARTGAAFLDQRLAASPFVAGERFTIADITLHVAMGFGRTVKFKPWETLPHIAEWRGRMNARPGLA